MELYVQIDEARSSSVLVSTNPTSTHPTLIDEGVTQMEIHETEPKNVHLGPTVNLDDDDDVYRHHVDNSNIIFLEPDDNEDDKRLQAADGDSSGTNQDDDHQTTPPPPVNPEVHGMYNQLILCIAELT